MADKERTRTYREYRVYHTSLHRMIYDAVLRQEALTSHWEIQECGPFRLGRWRMDRHAIDRTGAICFGHR